jgi:hypothetical protein
MARSPVKAGEAAGLYPPGRCDVRRRIERDQITLEEKPMTHSTKLRVILRRIEG